MGFWESMKKFAQPYADDDYDDFEEDEEVVETFEEEPAPRPARQRRTPPFVTATTTEDDEPVSTGSKVTGFSGHVVGSGAKQEVVLFHPVNFNDTSKAADYLRNKKAVIVNMENVDRAMARRVVDFLSGCAYALDGKVKKIAQSTYLFCPHHMDVVGDLESLQAEAESYV